MIHDKYEAKHFLLDPPQQVEVSEELATHLDDLVYQPHKITGLSSCKRSHMHLPQYYT